MWWFWNKAKHLPLSPGDYLPGCLDVMLGYTNTSQLMRIYYPTNCAKNVKVNSKKWLPWIPLEKYLIGIAKVIMIPVTFLKLIFWWTGKIQVPAIYGGELLKNQDKLKCIVFSHGMGASRFLYSKICCDLASYGFIIITLEHKDLSSCYTYFYNNAESAKTDLKNDIEFVHIPFGENHYKERNQQIHLRTKECSRIVDFLIGLNRGTHFNNVLDDVPSALKGDCKLEDFNGRLDLENLIMMGHSFGGATALNTVSVRKEFKYCILLDPWMFPIKNEELHKKVHQPILFINTQTFHIEANVKAMEKFLTNDNRKMYTIKHTTHEHQTDSPLIIGSWLNWFMKKLDPQIAININNNLILTFLNNFVKYPSDIDKLQSYLDKQKDNIEFGLTKPWA